MQSAWWNGRWCHVHIHLVPFRKFYLYFCFSPFYQCSFKKNYSNIYYKKNKSLLGKIFDPIILDKQQMSSETDVLPFGFKKNTSTIIYTKFVLKETIDYYNKNKTDCYLLLLDASNAFDRVEYNQLFNRLRDRNMCPIVLRLLINMYINQKIQVKWNDVLSNQYSISNNVKQGGCLSPTLFSIYLNDLIDVYALLILVVDMVIII